MLIPLKEPYIITPFLQMEAVQNTGSNLTHMNHRSLLTALKEDPGQTELIINKLSSNKERKTIHSLCEQLGLFSYSTGPSNKRIMIITKVKVVPEFEISDDDRKLFIKDSGLPIPVWRSPWFEYYIDLYKDIYCSAAKYDQFVKAVKILHAKGKQFSVFSRELMTIICDKTKSVPAYRQFVEDKELVCGEIPNNCDIYVKCDDNWPKYYITLDINKANFSAMKYFDKELVFGCDTWAEVVAKFTDIEYFANAKYFRQACLGNLKIKKMGSIQLFLLSHLYSLIKNNFKVVGRVSNDEIMIATTKETMMDDYQNLKEIIDGLPEKMQGIWRIEPFTIEPLGRSTVFIKKFYDEGKPDVVCKTEIKTVEKDFHAQAYKFYMGLPLCENDFRAMKDNWLITYGDKYSFD